MNSTTRCRKRADMDVPVGIAACSTGRQNFVSINENIQQIIAEIDNSEESFDQLTKH